jgi:cell division protein FtsX
LARYNNLFVQLEHADRAKAVTAQLQAYCPQVNEANPKVKTKRFYLDPFKGMARRDAVNKTFTAYTTGATPVAIVVTLVIMSVLILAIACFNLTNTLVAISTRRLKEIGLRKVMGGIRVQLMAQFIGESVLICFFAVLLGLAFSDILIQAWNTMWPFLKLEMDFGRNPHIVVFLAMLVLVIGCLSGIYPAVYISRFEPVQILKGKVDFGGTGYFTRTLLALQFAFSVLALFFSIAFYQNSVYQKNFAPGFAYNDLLVFPLDQPSDYGRLRDALTQQSDIVSIAGAEDNLFSSRTHAPVTLNNLDIEADIFRVGEGYRKTMGITLLEGRDFNPASENDRVGSAIISRDLARSAGLENALEKTIIINDSVKLFVIGIIDDVYGYGTWKAKQPLVLRCTDEATYKHIIIRTAAGKQEAVEDAAKQAWARLYPGKHYAGMTMASLMNVSEEISHNVMIIFTFLAVVALLLSIAGLYSSVSLNLARRTKEIGVRKVFGASVRQIVWVTNIQFAAILVLSSVAGCLLGTSLVGVTMRQLWVYYQAANAITFITATGFVLLLACVMIGTKVYRAAQANPIISLREE